MKFGVNRCGNKAHKNKTRRTERWGRTHQFDVAPRLIRWHTGKLWWKSFT